MLKTWAPSLSCTSVSHCSGPYTFRDGREENFITLNNCHKYFFFSNSLNLGYVGLGVTLCKYSPPAYHTKLTTLLNSSIIPPKVFPYIFLATHKTLHSIRFPHILLILYLNKSIVPGERAR